MLPFPLARLQQNYKVRVGRIAKLDAGETVKKLLAIGPAALVQVQRFRERKDLSMEVRERIDALAKKWSAKEAFDR